MGNIVLFPAPPPTYTTALNSLVYIPTSLATSSSRSASRSEPSDVESSTEVFPALFFRSRADNGSRYTLLYFHGNSCDLGDMYEELSVMQSFLECNILAIEFPGYGICQRVTASSSAKEIDLWSIAAFEWLIAEAKLDAINIIPFGRSIGTGPAAALAAHCVSNGHTIGGLILQSPYISIHKIVADYATTMATMFITDHWNTQSNLERIAPHTPLLVIHGQNDEIVPYYHGKQLFEEYTADEDTKMSSFPADSPHNEYAVLDHVALPVSQFLRLQSLSRTASFKKPVVARRFKQTPVVYEQEYPKSKTFEHPKFQDARELISAASSKQQQNSPSPLLPDVSRLGCGTAEVIETEDQLVLTHHSNGEYEATGVSSNFNWFCGNC